MSLKAVKLYLIQIFVIVFLSACSSGSSEESTDNTVTGTNARISLAVLDSENNEVTSITTGVSLALQVQLTTVTGLAITDHEVSFAATSGVISASSRLTDVNGQTSVTYDSDGVEPSVVTITATTIYNEEQLSITSQFEVLGIATGTETAELNVTFKQDGIATNRIQVDESAQVGVELSSSAGLPIANTIVNFTADLGNLSASSALTNSDGIAEVTVTGVTDQLGAGIATATAVVDNITVSDSLPYEVVSSDVVIDTSLKLGYLDDQGNFQPGILSHLTNSNSESTISAGGTLGIEVGIFNQDDALYTPPLTVSFASTCVSSGNATLDATTTTINGIATATFEDVSCATAFGNEDTIVATVTINSTDIATTHDLTIQPENLGSIEFVSADPESIVLKGTGGQGNQETATLTFQVRGELGNALAQQTVDFALNTDVGGLSLASESGVTNSEGLVSAKVISGTVPTAVRVTASVSVGESEISTQSDLLSLNTGLPDQNSITIALSQINPEAREIIDAEVIVSAYMADSFNNPVPDGTTVNFTTEGGSIGSSCNTTAGTCNVTWRSQEPFEDNHRVTILATAIGHESFVDVNGNNLFDTADGAAVTSDEVSSGFGRLNNMSSGFIDMSEAWRDDNENELYDSGEQFIDSVTEGDSFESFDEPDGLFNGPQCQGSLCAGSSQNSTIVRKSAVLITSSSNATYRISRVSNNLVLASGTGGLATGSTLSISNGDSVALNIELSDSADQTLPVGTTISLSATGAALIGTESFTIANTIGTTNPDGYGGLDFNINLSNEVDETQTGEFTVTVTTPSGRITEVTIPLTLPAP